MALIRLDKVYKTFGSFVAVNGVTFAVREGTCFGLLGPNGAGKSTVMKMLYGRCRRDSRSDSQIEVAGFDPDRDELSIKFLSGVVPQEDNLDTLLSVEKNLLIYAKFYGMKTDVARKRIAELLTFMELSEKRTATIRELSGGMKRRLVIGRALLHNPRILFLDEPTTGLDPQVRHLIWEKLRDLMARGLTILLTTHYMEEAFQMCDALCIMDKGRIVTGGTPGELINENVEKFVVETPGKKQSMQNISPEGFDAVRMDTGRVPPVYYSDNLDTLKAFADTLGDGYFIRQSNLEDVFLKITGRKLNEHQ